MSSPPLQDARPDGSGLLILWEGINSATTDETDLNDWWTNEHFPERLRLPGFQRARRYRTIEARGGRSEYLACYEASDVQDFTSPKYLHALNNPTSRTKKFMPCLAEMHRSACRVYPIALFNSSTEASNALILIVLHSVCPSTEFVKSIQLTFDKHLRQVNCFQQTVHAHIAMQDETITEAGSTSRSYDGVQFTQEHGNDRQQPTRKYIALFELNVSEPVKREPSTAFNNEHFHAFVEHMAILDIQVGYRNTFQLISALARSDIDLLTE